MQAIDLFSVSGRTSQAASLAKDCAEKLEEDYNYEDALKFFEKASQLYEIENSVSYSNQMLAKWADLSVITEDKKQFAKIIKTYDKIGKKYLSQPLIKSSAKDYFFKVCLCFLANNDMPGAKRSIENYTYEDPNFDTSKQKDLLDDIVRAIDIGDGMELAKCIGKYSQTWQLDKVTVKLLADIKKKHAADPETVGDVMRKELNLIDGGDDHDDEEIDSSKKGPKGGFDLT